MIPFETIKQNLSLVEVAQDFGLDVGRSSMARCPFHDDHSPSLYIADDHYHCYGCGAHGDVIDFTERLFGLGLRAAVEKLAMDYGLKESNSSATEPRYRNRLRQQIAKLKTEQINFTPQSPEEEWHPAFVNALIELPYLRYQLEGENTSTKIFEKGGCAYGT